MTDKEKEYWNSRINNIYDKNYEAKKIELLYKKAYYEVEGEIKKLYEELKDKGELTTTKLYQYDRFMSLRRQIKSQCKDIRSSLTSEVRKKLSQSYKETFQTVNKMLGQDNTWGIQNQKMAQKVINTKWEGSNFSKRIWKNTDSLAKDIESNIVSCVINGTNKDTIVKIIKNRYNVGFNKADRLVRTELMHTINSAQIDTYKEDGVEYVEWYAAEDERMCSICGEMHEKKFKTTEAPSIAHANCRCTLLPVVDKILTKGLGSKDTSKSETEEHKLPKKLEKIEDMSYNNIINVLEKYEDEIVNSDTEQAIVITKNGQVYKCYGTEDSVFPEDLSKEELKGSYITHNHPKSVTAYSFSDRDIKFFEDYELSILRGTDYKYTYILDRYNTNTDEVDDNILNMTFEQYKHILNSIYLKKKNIGYRRIKK